MASPTALTAHWLSRIQTQLLDPQYWGIVPLPPPLMCAPPGSVEEGVMTALLRSRHLSLSLGHDALGPAVFVSSSPPHPIAEAWMAKNYGKWREAVAGAGPPSPRVVDLLFAALAKTHPPQVAMMLLNALVNRLRQEAELDVRVTGTGVLCLGGSPLEMRAQIFEPNPPAAPELGPGAS